MFDMSVRLASWLEGSTSWIQGTIPAMRRRVRLEGGQTTAEYALVILAAAAVALVLIAWVQSTGRLPAFFDKVVDDLIDSF
jgi:Flp pilus assembly pilin Flp